MGDKTTSSQGRRVKNKLASAKQEHDKSEALQGLGRSGRDTSWIHSRSTRGILQKNNTQSATHGGEESCSLGYSEPAVRSTGAPSSGAAHPSSSVTSEHTTARAGTVGPPQPAYPPARTSHPNPPPQTLPQPAYPPARTSHPNPPPQNLPQPAYPPARTSYAQPAPQTHPQPAYSSARTSYPPPPPQTLEERPHRGHTASSQPHGHEPYAPRPHAGSADRDANRRTEEGVSLRVSHSQTPVTTPREGYVHTPTATPREGYGPSYGAPPQGGNPMSARSNATQSEPATTATQPSVHSAGPGLSAQQEYYSRPLTGGSSTGRDHGPSSRGPDPTGRDQGRSPRGPDPLPHTPREETGSVHSMTSEPEAWNSRASSPRSTVALQQAQTPGNGHAQGGDHQRWVNPSGLASVSSTPAGSVSMASNYRGAHLLSPVSEAGSGSSLTSKTPKGLRGHYQAINALVPVTDMAFQLFGDPGLAAKCDTALHLDLEGLAKGDEATRVTALLDAAGLLRSCLAQMGARREALLDHCLRWGRDLEIQQRRASQEAAQVAQQRDEARGYLALAKERQRRLEVALQERDQEVLRLQTLVERMESFGLSGQRPDVPTPDPDLTLEWIRQSTRIMERLGDAAVPVREDTSKGIASPRGDVTPPPPPEAAEEATPTRTPAASPSGASRQINPETPMMSPMPTPQPLPPPGRAPSEDDGFFNAWSWLALLRS